MPRILRRSLPGVLLIAALQLNAANPSITVYKTRTCGCCGKWVDHLKANGFRVTVEEVASTAPSRQQYGVPEKLLSCHTAVVGDYAIEGHVPAADILSLLKDRPKGRGLAVPGMPIGSPGMEQGPRRDAYSVILFDDKGQESEYQRYPANARP